MNTMNMMKAARIGLGLSQVELEDKARVPRVTISRLENGTTRNPELGTAMKLSEVLMIAPELLLEAANCPTCGNIMLPQHRNKRTDRWTPARLVCLLCEAARADKTNRRVG